MAESRERLGRRRRRGTVVGHDDVIGGQRQLVPAARGGAVDRADIALAGQASGLLDAVASLVGELAEIHLPAVAGLGKHRDVGAGAEHAILG